MSRFSPILVVLVALLCLALSACDVFGGKDDGAGLRGRGGFFGNTVALHGDVALVGAIERNETYVFEREAGTWRETDVLRPGGGSDSRDPSFSWSLALSEGVAVVGAPEIVVDDSDSGQAYIFESAGSAWRRSLLFDPSSMSPRANLAWVVSASDNRVAVGVPKDRAEGLTNGYGSIRIIEPVEGAWTETHRAESDSGALNGGFGGSVALDGDRLATQTTGTAETGVRSAGVVYVLEFDGAAWKEVAALSAPDPQKLDVVGGDLALDGPTLVAAGPGRDTFGHSMGSVLVFREEGGAWALEAELAPPDLHPDDAFGHVVDVSGDRLVSGAVYRSTEGVRNHGAVFVYARQPDGTWVLEAELTHANPGRGDLLGEDVAIDGDRILAGAPGVDGDRGAAFIFERIDGVWQQAQ